MHNLPKGLTIDPNSVLRTSQRKKLKKYSALLFMALILHPALYHHFLGWAQQGLSHIHTQELLTVSCTKEPCGELEISSKAKLRNPPTANQPRGKVK